MDQSRAVHKMCLKCGRKWSNWYTCTCFHEPVSPLCHPSLEKSHLGMKSDDKYLFFSSPSLCGKHQKCQDPALTSIYIPQNWHFPCAGHATSCTHLPTWALPQSHPTHKKNNNQPKNQIATVNANVNTSMRGLAHLISRSETCPEVHWIGHPPLLHARKPDPVFPIRLMLSI